MKYLLLSGEKEEEVARPNNGKEIKSVRNLWKTEEVNKLMK